VSLLALAVQPWRRRKETEAVFWLRVPLKRIHVSAVQTPASSGVKRRLVMIIEFQGMWKEAVEVCFNILNKVPNVLVVSGSKLGSEACFH
jgi:hypothetical protein